MLRIMVILIIQVKVHLWIPMGEWKWIQQWIWILRGNVPLQMQGLVMRMVEIK